MGRADDTTLLGYLRRMLCAGALAAAPDEALLGQFVARRDEAAFAVLVRRHGPMVWGVCRRLLGNAADAEDAFQATFLLLARKAASIQRRELLANWLFGVARRSALRVRTLQARRARQERSWGELPDVPATAEDPWNDARAVLDEELARLPAKYRLPLLLCELEGLTHAEAGESLGWPTGTVAGRLSRGRTLLRTRLLRRGVTAPVAALTGLLTATTVPQRVAAAIPDLAAAAAGGKAATLPPAVAMLLQRGLRTAALSRWLTTAALVAALAVALGGGGAVWHLARSAQRIGADAPGTDGDQPNSVGPVWLRRADTTAPGKPGLRLPSDPNAIVVHMERFVASAAAPGMVLTICADGRAVAELPDGLLSAAPTDLTRYAARARAPGSAARKTKVLRGRLRAREVEELLQFAVHDQEFFDFDPAAVKAAIQEQYRSDGKVSDPTDATTTGFRVRTADRSHEVKWSRLAKSAWDFPRVQRLLQLYALDRRLQQIVYVLVAGGPERVEAVAERMNELARPYYCRYPAVPWLTAADLFRVTPSEDGSRMRFTFCRNRDGTLRTPRFEVGIDVPQRGEPALAYVILPQS
jgi:RNA polymerase sigma factor (sigma-70 family)